jgi:hypothetical protein
MRIKICALVVLFLILILLLAIGWPIEPSSANGQGEYNIYFPSINKSPNKRCAATSILYFQDKTLSIQQLKDLGINCSYLYTQATSFTDTSIKMSGTIGWNDSDTTNLGGTSGYFLGWNEPDLNPNVTLAAAATKWKTVVESNASIVPVSPGPSHIHPEWLLNWRNQYITTWGVPPALGALAIHCYGTPATCQNVVSQVIGYADAWGIPEVWVTEFAFTPAWSSTWEKDAETFIAWMEAQPKIKYYFWWAVAYPDDDPCCPWASGFNTQLFDWDTGEITELGEFYRAVP